MPRAGGEYVYIKEAYGSLLGFLSGWMSLTIGFSAAIALNAHLFAIHLQQLFNTVVPQVGTDSGSAGASLSRWLLDTRVIALAMVWSLTLIHALGAGAGGFVQRLLTVVKVGAIMLLVVAGAWLGEGQWDRVVGGDVPAVGATVPLNVSAVLVSFLFVTFAYSGFNAAGYIAGEMVDPQRSIPRATVWATLCVTGLYLALNAIYLYAAPMTLLAAEPIEPVARKTASAMFGDAAAWWITLLLCVSILGAASAMVWAGPRVYYAMARDGVFPAMFAGTTRAGAAPVRSILLQSVWISVLVLSGTFETLVIYAGFVLIVFTAVAVGAVPILRASRPNQPPPYRVKAYPLVPALFLLISLAVMGAALWTRPTESLLGVATVLAGVPFYFLWKRRYSQERAEDDRG